MHAVVEASQAVHGRQAMLLTTTKAAELIGMSASWLEHDRMKKKPTIPFVKVGRRTVRYRMSDLLSFIGSLQVAA